MPYIKVSPSALSSMSETLRNSSSKVGRIESDFSGVARKLDWDVRSASDIQRRMDRIIDALENHASMLGDMRSFIGEAKRKYEAAQKEDAKLQKKYLKAINKVSASAKTTELTDLLISTHDISQPDHPIGDPEGNGIAEKDGTGQAFSLRRRCPAGADVV